MNPIPNYIFQTWKTKKNIDSKRKRYIKTVKLYNPDMEYFLYDDEDCSQFVQDKFPQYYTLYTQLKIPVQKADLWRYLVIYYYGGYYLDIDCKSVRGFSNIKIPPDNKKDLLITEIENPVPLKPIDGFPRNPQYAQYWFGATPRHPAIKKVIERVIKNIQSRNAKSKNTQLKNAKSKNYGKGDEETLYLTGPVPWTDGIKNHMKHHTKDIYCIQPNYADVCAVKIDTQLIHNYKNTPVIHCADGSWRTEDNSNYLTVVMVIIVILIFVYLLVRFWKY